MTISVCLSVTLCTAVHSRGENTDAESPTSLAPTDDAARINRLEQSVQATMEENRRLLDKLLVIENQCNFISSVVTASSLNPQNSSSSQALDIVPPAPDSLPLPSAPTTPIGIPQPFWVSPPNQFTVGYDNGFVIVPNNLNDNPFSLKINSQTVFRLAGFERDHSTWTDSAGNVNPISNTAAYQIPRGRLIFSGKVYDPKLSYLLNIDYNTVTNNPIGFRAYEMSYRFNRAIELHVGQSKVPGTREWIESAFAPLEGPDRSMATTFFRPSLSQGIWIDGQLENGFHYIAMMSNGFNTLNLTPSQLNDRFCWSGSAWWEPWGEFGRGYADLEFHENPVIRFGASYTFALGSGSQSSSDAVENSSIRLSNGTLITQLGALAPGVTLQSYDISLAAYDISYKWRGLSLSTEWFLQNLSSLQANGPIPVSSTQAYGGFLQGGYFVVPQKAEFYSRSSFVAGAYGSGWETAGGLNWFFIPGKSNLRFTFDTAWLENSPASQNRTGYVAGQSGLLIRTQMTMTF